MTRGYVQRRRAEAAQQTRRQVLDTAREELLGEGRLEFNVGRIAATAGVARSTVYAIFGSRTGLLTALSNETLERAGLAVVIAEYRRPDALAALEGSLHASCRMYAADQRAFARLLALAGVDPEAAEPLARSQRDRAMGMADLASRLAAAGRLRPDVTPEHAADVLWLLTGFWSFDELSTGRGLDADACTEVLLEIARATLLVPARAEHAEAS